MIDISGVMKGIYRVPMFMSVVYGITPQLLHSASGFQLSLFPLKFLTKNMSI